MQPENTTDLSLSLPYESFREIDRGRPTIRSRSRRTPQSAHIYASGNVSSHPIEKVGDTVERTIMIGEPSLLAIPDTAWNDIPDSLRTALRPVDAVGGWRLFVTTPLGSED